jgi:hypothetical protein
VMKKINPEAILVEEFVSEDDTMINLMTDAFCYHFITKIARAFCDCISFDNVMVIKRVFCVHGFAPSQRYHMEEK